MAEVTKARLVEILLVEDNDLDAEATILSARETRLANRIHHVIDGGAALDFLYRRGAYAGAPRPDLVLLDLNLPGIHGREVLKRIKSDDALKTIPVVILTTSKEDEDVLRSYELGANAFIRKPVVPEGFIEVALALDAFWIGIVELPPRKELP